MAAPRPKKRALSDRLKGMRFMKRREETNLREKLLQEQTQRRKDAHWTAEPTDQTPATTSPLVLVEEGVTHEYTENRIGRQSFGKFNSVFEAKKIDSQETSTETKVARDQPVDAQSTAKEPINLNAEAESHPLAYKKVDLLGATKVIAKKRRKRTGGSTSHANLG